MAITDGSGFWAFVFWSTVILTSLIIGLNVFEILPKLQMSFSYTDKVILGYTVLYTIFYGICAIISFISFSLSAIIVYLLLFLFCTELFLAYCRNSRNSQDPEAPKYWFENSSVLLFLLFLYIDIQKKKQFWMDNSIWNKTKSRTRSNFFLGNLKKFCAFFLIERDVNIIFLRFLGGFFMLRIIF